MLSYSEINPDTSIIPCQLLILTPCLTPNSPLQPVSDVKSGLGYILNPVTEVEIYFSAMVGKRYPCPHDARIKV